MTTVLAWEKRKMSLGRRGMCCCSYAHNSFLDPNESDENSVKRGRFILSFASEQRKDFTKTSKRERARRCEGGVPRGNAGCDEHIAPR
jgi:hypothetical protein